jgi:hypothetical protein
MLLVNQLKNIVTINNDLEIAFKEIACVSIDQSK